MVNNSAGLKSNQQKGVGMFSGVGTAFGPLDVQFIRKESFSEVEVA